MKYAIMITVLVSCLVKGFGQIRVEHQFSTFGMIAVDTIENTWGCALATNNLAIGQAGVYDIVADQGIVVSIAFTNPQYPIKGIDMLKKGYALQTTFDSIKNSDAHIFYRQVAMMDSIGNTLSFTGHTIKSLSHAGTIKGNKYVVVGNSLSNDSVLASIEKGYLNSQGPLYQRLLDALTAGQKAGGQITGKLSACICVKKSGHVGFNEIDYRVDFSKTPFEDLRTLAACRT